MTYDELQKRINQYVKLDLNPLFEAYRGQTPNPTLEGFIQFLSNARVIDTTLLKELHTAGDVEIPQANDAALAGTKLATWARDAATLIQDHGPAKAAGGASAATAAADVRYTPLALLGQGAMGAIQIARDLYLRRKVALKTVLPAMAAHPQLLGRFLSEMQITAQLEHPNIVPIYALEIGADGTLGYAMKLVQGRDLAQLIDETRAMVEKGTPLDEDHTLEKRLEHFLKVCDALDVAHAKGIIHRDLKPANVMIGLHNEVYLMDWGIARPMGAGGQALESGIELHQADGEQVVDLARTRVGSAIGTPMYMSPEQAAGRNAELDGRSDQYSMGLILQECVSLKRAVGGTTLQEVLTKAKEAKRDPIAVGTRLGDVPKEIEAIVSKATRLRPEDRYPTVRALADDVRRFLRNEAVLAMPDGPVRKATRWLSKHRMASLTIMLSLALVGSAATIGALVVGQARIEALHSRELRVSELQTESAIQAQLVDRELTRYESSLSQFVGAAQLALSKPTMGETGPYFGEQFAQPGAAPADMGPSRRYGKDVSVLHPVVSLAPGVDRGALDPLLRSLGSLSPAFGALMIDSGGGQSHKMSAAQKRDAIAGVGVPALRAVVTLSDGATLYFPGMAGMPAADLRKDPMYKLVEDKTGVHWGAPITRDGQVVLPAAAALRDEKGAFRGVAMLEVSLDRLLARPDAPALDYVQSKQLVGRDGKVMAEESAGGAKEPISPQVLDAISKGKSGSLETAEGGKKRITTYYPLATLDWYYVAVADVDKMLSSKAKVSHSDPRKVIAAAAKRPAVPAKAATAAPVVELPDAGVDAGDDAGDGGDAGDDAGDGGDGGDDGGPAVPAIDLDAVDAGAGTWTGPDGVVRKRAPGPMPTGAPSAKPTATPRDPFDKWQELEKKKGKAP